MVEDLDLALYPPRHSLGACGGRFGLQMIMKRRRSRDRGSLLIRTVVAITSIASISHHPAAAVAGSSSPSSPSHAPPNEVDWDSFGFGLVSIFDYAARLQALLH